MSHEQSKPDVIAAEVPALAQFPIATVGDIGLPEGSPAWMINLVTAVARVEPHEVVSHLEGLVAQIKSAGHTRAVAEVKKLIDKYELKPEQVFPVKSAAGGRAVVKPKFRDPDTDQTWSGRGAKPKWLHDKNPEDFRI